MAVQLNAENNLSSLAHQRQLNLRVAESQARALIVQLDKAIDDQPFSELGKLLASYKSDVADLAHVLNKAIANS